MKRWLLTAWVLAGCGGQPFSERLFVQGDAQVPDDAVSADGDAGGTADAASENAAGDAAEDSACGVVHDNGVGQTWTDCVPLGTYNEAQATKACLAYTIATYGCSDPHGCDDGSVGGCYANNCTDGLLIYTVNLPSSCNSALWSWWGATAGHVVAGCHGCPSVNDPSWN